MGQQSRRQKRDRAMQYAKVGNSRQRARPGRVGRCPLCGGEVLAKCGSLRHWHWAHRSLVDCDAWSEPVGPWHLAWQQLVRPPFVEVAVGPHRADIRTPAGLVIELQHSPIDPREIAERERFYGRMLWVFDATHRFWCTRSGDWCFFSLGRTLHLLACRRPVLLDFGAQLVQVEMMGETHRGFSGFGRVRDRHWFTREHLSKCCKSGPLPPIVRSQVESCEPWPGGQPWRLTEHATRWIDPQHGASTIIPRNTVFIPIPIAAPNKRVTIATTWSDELLNQPELSNGWRRDELHAMQQFLGGMPMILAGRLRMMPPRAKRIQVRQTVRAVERSLAQLDNHIEAGRIPILKPDTRQLLLERAAQFELKSFGTRLGYPEYRHGLAKKPPTRRP